MNEQSDKLQHESYGSIAFTHRHSHPKHTFGSPVQHTDLINIQINTATLIRSTSKDLIFDDEQVFSGYLSQAQLAEAMFSMNNGPATPITIEYVSGDTKRRQEPPPPKDTDEQFQQEVQALLYRITADCQQLADTNKGKIRQQALGIKHSLENNIQFIQQRMKEHLYHVADQAKREIDAHRERTIRQAGLDAIHSLQHSSQGKTKGTGKQPQTPDQSTSQGTSQSRPLASMSAMSSINRVLEAHGEEIRRQWAEQVPKNLILDFKQVNLENATHSIRIEWEFDNGATLPGPAIDIDELSEMYPDCNPNSNPDSNMDY